MDDAPVDLGDQRDGAEANSVKGSVVILELADGHFDVGVVIEIVGYVDEYGVVR